MLPPNAALSIDASAIPGLSWTHQRVSQLPKRFAAATQEIAMMQASKLHGDIPADAFEPVPIGRNRMFARSIGPSLSESALDKVLEALKDTRSFTTHTKEELCSFFDSLPADAFDEVPVPAKDVTKSIPALDEITPTLSSSSRKRPTSSRQVIAIAVPPPSPKRRRTEREPSLRRYQQTQWTEQFEELLKFNEQHGHCAVPHSNPENQVLARWVKRQRYQYKLKMAGKETTMNEARTKRLENIGFVWDSHAVIWNKRFQELQDYRDRYGDCNVPSNYAEKELAVWVKCQRRQYKLFCDNNKSSSMTMERIRALNELGFIRKLREE